MISAIWIRLCLLSRGFTQRLSSRRYNPCPTSAQSSRDRNRLHRIRAAKSPTPGCCLGSQQSDMQVSHATQSTQRHRPIKSHNLGIFKPLTVRNKCCIYPDLTGRPGMVTATKLIENSFRSPPVKNAQIPRLTEETRLEPALANILRVGRTSLLPCRTAPKRI
jgi:hypothetical protein